jgi:hypothetical protein
MPAPSQVGYDLFDHFKSPPFGRALPPSSSKAPKSIIIFHNSESIFSSEWFSFSLKKT